MRGMSLLLLLLLLLLFFFWGGGGERVCHVKTSARGSHGLQPKMKVGYLFLTRVSTRNWT